MWRNVSWNSTDSALPDGMHKHETGAYFKTPSLQSAGSSQSGTRRQDSLDSIGKARPATPLREDADEPWPGRAGADEASGGQQLTGARLQVRRPRFKEAPAERRAGAGQPPPANKQVAGPAPQGFRSRLSSISGALQHPKLARRLFSGHHEPGEQQHAAPVQITTTSIDSPQHAGPADGPGEPAGAHPGAGEPRLPGGASGRRLSQLFLPQMGQNALLNQMQDPYASHELIPPHLLGLYGQPPLVAGASSPAGHRASWADASLFGRLSNVRPSIDSAFQSGQMRHSFDARK